MTLRQEDSPQARRLLGELSRIEQYVEMALTYLRLESAESDYVFRDCALDPIIRQSVKRFSAEFIGRKIRLDYEPADYTLVTDEKWLGFVLVRVSGEDVALTPKEFDLLVFLASNKGIRRTRVIVHPKFFIRFKSPNCLLIISFLVNSKDSISCVLSKGSSPSSRSPINTDS